MKITFKEPITTEKGVTYPAGYVYECDALINLQNGLTELAQAGEVHPGLPPVVQGTMRVGVRDLHKLDIKLEMPQ